MIFEQITKFLSLRALFLEEKLPRCLTLIIHHIVSKNIGFKSNEHFLHNKRNFSLAAVAGVSKFKHSNKSQLYLS